MGLCKWCKTLLIVYLGINWLLILIGSFPFYGQVHSKGYELCLTTLLKLHKHPVTTFALMINVAAFGI